MLLSSSQISVVLFRSSVHWCDHCPARTPSTASRAIKKESVHLPLTARSGEDKVRGVGSCQINVCFCRFCKYVIVWVLFSLCWCEDGGSQDGLSALWCWSHGMQGAARNALLWRKGYEGGKEGEERWIASRPSRLENTGKQRLRVDMCGESVKGTVNVVYLCKSVHLSSHLSLWFTFAILRFGLRRKLFSGWRKSHFTFY